jgi:2-iminobutanoate/2-iminopropanoate deaminase
MPPKVIQTSQAPKALGPYSQAVQVEARTWTFLSGQIPLDPKTGEMVVGDISTQTVRVMENLGAVLTAAGLNFSNVVRCGIFLADLADFARMNEVYAKYFSGAPPARSTVQVAALPKGARIEIDAIAAS